MKERPIVFSGPMVRAILDGRKTMTRRVFKTGKIIPAELNGKRALIRICPYGQPGDRLWVRETFKLWPNGEIFYAATPTPEKRGKFIPLGNWKPSIFMPRWASRITLEITAVRVERVQDISEGDVEAEGLSLQSWAGHEDDWPKTAGFTQLWDSLNAKRGYGWDVNPWVWAISFKRLP